VIHAFLDKAVSKSTSCTMKRARPKWNGPEHMSHVILPRDSITCAHELLTQLSQKTFACVPSHPQNSSRVVLCGSSTAVSTVSDHATGILHRHLTPRFVLVQHVPSLLALPLLSSCIAHAPCFLSQFLLLFDPPVLKQKQQQVETSIHAPGQG